MKQPDLSTRQVGAIPRLPTQQFRNRTYQSGTQTGSAPIFIPSCACTVMWVLVQLQGAATAFSITINGQAAFGPFNLNSGAMVRFPSTYLANNEQITVQINAGVTFSYSLCWVKDFVDPLPLTTIEVSNPPSSGGGNTNVDIFDSVGNQILASTAVTANGALRVEGCHSTGDLGAKFLVVGGLKTGQAIPLLVDNNGAVSVNVAGPTPIEVDGSSGNFPIVDSSGNALNSNGSGALEVDGSAVVQPTTWGEIIPPSQVWNNTTPNGTTFTVKASGKGGCVASFCMTRDAGAITTGQLIVEASWDGVNFQNCPTYLIFQWQLPSNQGNTTSIITIPTAPSTITAFQVLVAGAPIIRLRMATTITGVGQVTISGNLTPSLPATFPAMLTGIGATPAQSTNFLHSSDGTSLDVSIRNSHVSVSVDQIATTNVTTGVGASTAGTQRVVLSTDSIGGAAAALADATANPTLGKLQVFEALFNGTTWDRSRNNVNTTTGDTGAKAATFNGATQTNFDARGAFITILLGAVSGTTPTLSAQLQWSPDGGTNWFNIGPALANLTTTNQTGTIAIYPSNFSQTPGATPANLTLGTTVSNLINSPLPRTWRIVYTLGGTTPSFTINSVQVNYIK